MSDVAASGAGRLEPELGTERFVSYRDGLVHDWMKILAVLGVVLVPLFLLLDYVTMPGELLSRFAVYRGVATLSSVTQLGLLRVTKPSRFSFVHGYVFSFIVCGMVTLMTVDLGGFSSGYYVGLMLVIFPVNVLLPWRSYHAAANGILAVGSYVLANLVFGGEFTAGMMVNNLYFLLSSVVLVVAMSETRYRLIQREFGVRAELEDTNAVLEKSRADLKQARDRLWSEMEVAQRIQTALLPRNRTLGGWEIEATMRPAEEVGGDYYDFLETRHGERWLAIGDVSGHGVESGLVMMMTQTAVATLVNDRAGRTPSDVFVHTNQVIRENVSRLGGHRYMTLNIIRLEASRLVVAGKHQDLLVWRAATGALEIVSNQGPWIGVVDDVRHAVEDQALEVGVGDWVLLYSDGLTEATDAQGRLFGEDRLRDAFGAVAGKLSLQDAVSSVIERVRAYQQRQDDDLTLVLLRRAS
ncbi:MAG: PP2C family protein-serine/threonine phosphatase [Myxococcaceae bacterium]|nr:PP2C family protein-serine/threonine phosphatase [Myxococcaceae bacterium]